MPDAYDIETQPFTDGTGTSTNYSQPQSEGKMPPLNLARAQHILDRFTEDPSWLANPRTSRAANAIFSAASKVVGMGIQMERVTNMGIATKNLNEFTKQKVDALSKVAAFVPEDDVTGQAELGRLNGMVSTMSTPDFNLQEFSAGVSRLQSRYQKPSQMKVFAPSTGEKEDAYLQRLIDEGASPEMIQIQRDRIAAHSQTPEAKADLAFQSYVSKLDAGQRKKKVAELTKHIDNAEAQATAHLKSGDETQADAFRAMAGSYRRKLSVIERDSPSAISNAPVTATSAPSADELIDAVNPSGKKVRIRKGQADDARKSGYTIQ